MALVIRRFDVYLVNLDPTVGAEIRKTRPCVVVSPDEMNQNISTVIVAPMTTRGRSYPTRVNPGGIPDGSRRFRPSGRHRR